jgi:thiamine pyrophosphate-dependent acetolactate synthase large subunit-like protein
MTGGEQVAEVLVRRGVRFLYTLCGGHIAPILVAAKHRGIRVLDVRDEASAAFAADASSRLSGIPGVAAVTAGPGVTNTITAIKNAQLAQSPLVLLGGATGTILKGRGSLQDIDQAALFEPHVKWLATVDRVRDLAAAVEQAFDEALLGVPGPVFVECPVDLLYEEELVRKLYGVGDDAPPPRSFGEKAQRAYLRWHLGRLFGGAPKKPLLAPQPLPVPLATGSELKKVAGALAKAQRPVLVVGSQAVVRSEKVGEIAAAIEKLGLPTYLSGMARGLLGAASPVQLRHQRKQALKEADLVILAGVPSDFRLDYGRNIGGKTRLVSFNLSGLDLYKNRKPDLPLLADPGRTLISLAALSGGGAGRAEWLSKLRGRDEERDNEIAGKAAAATAARESGAAGKEAFIDPIFLCRAIDRALDENSVVVADGGDFVATASYILRPRGPLRWLDPGVFGTLGVGGGFALGAKAERRDAEVWLLWGDGSAAYSLAEFDAFARHGLPVIAVVGNDAGWTQIAREQVEILGDDCGTVLARTDYHRVAEGYGGKGIVIRSHDEVEPALQEAKRLAREGHPVLINAWLGKTDFRKGSISM